MSCKDKLSRKGLITPMVLYMSAGKYIRTTEKVNNAIRTLQNEINLISVPMGYEFYIGGKQQTALD